MKISVVMATYNGEKYLEEQLESIRLQTVQPDEVILCDDCSTDYTVEKAEEYIERYNLQDMWRVVVNSENLGYANNFDKAAKMAGGEIIFFADQDDLWVPEKIQKMLDVMADYPQCQVLCTDYEPFSDSVDAPKVPTRILKQMPDDGSLEKVSLKKKSIYLRTLGCCMCVKKSFYEELQGYWFNGWAQDDRLWRLSQCIDGCYLLHTNLVKHRLHGNNTSTYGKYHTKEKRIKLFQDKQNANLQMMKMLQKENADRSHQKVARKHISMMKLRLELLEKRKLINVFFLLFYFMYYDTPKSMMVELYIALRRNNE